VDGRVLATGLCLPEGPLVTAAGRVLFVQIGRGVISELHPDGSVTTFAAVAGAPHALVEGSDGRVFVTQAGDVNISGPTPEPVDAGIQAVDPDGTVSWLVREVDGEPLVAPNDLCFGADGRLYFTDSGGGYNPSDAEQRARVCAVDAAGEAETVVWLGASYANGIGVDRDGVLFWSESYNNCLCALRDGERWVELTLESPPDGFLHAADGRVAVASTTRGLTVASRRPDGAEGETFEVESTFDAPTFATNVAADGEALYVTDFGDYFNQPREEVGRLWRVELPLEPVATEGLR
jgi:gluconolactonase